MISGGGGGGGLPQVATTGEAGFALQNATPTILSWTAPDDGNLHTIIVVGITQTASACTGGEIKATCTLAGISESGIVSANSLPGVGPYSWGSGSHANNGWGSAMTMLCDPGSTVLVQQATALTAGAATAYATLFAA